MRGNADRELAASARGTGKFVPDPIFPWAARQLRPADLPVLDALPLTVSLGGVLFCHATPRDDTEIVLVDSPLERWAEVLDGVTASTSSSAGTRTCRSSGSSTGGWSSTPAASGCRTAPGARTGRCSATASGCGGHRYDVEEACRFLIARSGYPGIEEWADYFVRNPASDAEALRVFSGRWNEFHMMTAA